MFTKLFKLLALLLGLAAVAAVFLGYDGRPAMIAVVHPATGPAVQAVYATGTVEPEIMIPVSPRSTARLAEIHADEGDKVMAGEMLARMEDEDILRSIEEAEADAELAQKDYDRTATLAASGFATGEALEKTEAALKSATARLEKTRVSVEYLTLSAPEDGRIIRRDGEVGELVPAGQPVFYMSSGDGLRITAEVDEEDIALVQPGQKTLIRADAFPDKVFESTVQSVTPKGDPVSRSYRVRIGLDPATPLMAGMTAEANIVIHEKKEALLVPASAVRDGKVWIVKDDKALPQPVTIGARAAEAVEIVQGVSVEDNVIRDPSKDIEAGQAVRTQLELWAVP